MSTIKPVRIRLSRAKGWRLVSPNGLPVVIVDRRGRWGNRYRLLRHDPNKPATAFRRSAADECIEALRLRIINSEWRLHDIRLALSGRNLACWCHIWQCPVCGRFHDFDTGEAAPWCVNKDQASCQMVRVPCHADVLLELANPGWKP